MTREIKFEIWDPKFKVMYRDDDIESLDLAKGTYIQDSVQNPVTEGCEELLSEVILRQWTGLTDKSGKPIYEGDIVRIEDGRIGKVIYDPAIFRIVDENGKFITSGYPDWDLCKALGNIYENPELLTNKKE